MTTWRRPPTCMPLTHLRKPGMTPPPVVKGSVSSAPRLQDESNSLQSLKKTPTYFTATLEPSLASGPVPTTTSVVVVAAGAAAPGSTEAAGLVFRSFVVGEDEQPVADGV